MNRPKLSIAILVLSFSASSFSQSACNQFKKQEAKNHMNNFMAIQDQKDRFKQGCLTCEDKRIVTVEVEGHFDIRKIPKTSLYEVTLDGKPLQEYSYAYVSYDDRPYRSFKDILGCAKDPYINKEDWDFFYKSFKGFFPSQLSKSQNKECLQKIKNSQRAAIEESLAGMNLSASIEESDSSTSMLREGGSDLHPIYNLAQKFVIQVTDSEGRETRLESNVLNYQLKLKNYETLVATEDMFDSLGNFIDPADPRIGSLNKTVKRLLIDVPRDIEIKNPQSGKVISQVRPESSSLRCEYLLYE